MNLVRQYVAVSLLFVAFTFFERGGEYKIFIVCFLLAALFHYSVLVIFHSFC